MCFSWSQDSIIAYHFASLAHVKATVHSAKTCETMSLHFTVPLSISSVCFRLLSSSAQSAWKNLFRSRQGKWLVRSVFVVGAGQAPPLPSCTVNVGEQMSGSTVATTGCAHSYRISTTEQEDVGQAWKERREAGQTGLHPNMYMEAISPLHCWRLRIFYSPCINQDVSWECHM